MRHHHFGDLVAYLHHRVETAARVLKQHANVLAELGACEIWKSYCTPVLANLGKRPAMVMASVDFPEPLSPITVSLPPLARSKDTSCKAAA